MKRMPRARKRHRRRSRPPARHFLSAPYRSRHVGDVVDSAGSHSAREVTHTACLARDGRLGLSSHLVLDAALDVRGRR